MVTTTKTSTNSTTNIADIFSKTYSTNVSSKTTSELYNKVDNNKTTLKFENSKSEDFKDILNSKANSKDEDTQKVNNINKNETSDDTKDTSQTKDTSETKDITKVDELNEKLKELEEDSKSASKDDINEILNEILNLLNKLGINEEDLKSKVEINSDILKTIVQGINEDKTSNSNLSSTMEKILELLKSDSVKGDLDNDSLKSMEKILSNLSANLADDNTEATKNLKSGIKNLMTEVSNLLENKQNQNEKVLTLEDMLNKNYSQSNKDSSTESQSNKNATSEATKDTKENKFLNSLINDDKDSSLNKINLFATRAQTVQNQQGVDNVKGLTINKATFADDLIKDVKFMSTNALKELTVKVNPGDLGEITIKLIQEDGVMKANLKANSKETTALLSQNLVDIKKQLGEQNIKIADVNIELYQDDTTFFKEQGFEGQLSQEQGRSNNSKSSNENNVINSQEEPSEKLISTNNNLDYLA